MFITLSRKVWWGLIPWVPSVCWAGTWACGLKTTLGYNKIKKTIRDCQKNNKIILNLNSASVSSTVMCMSTQSLHLLESTKFSTMSCTTKFSCWLVLVQLYYFLKIVPN